MAIPPATTSPWTNFGNTGNSVLQVNTTGDQQIAGHQRIPGSVYGAVPADFTNAAQAVFPHYDGATNTLPAAQRPATFGDAAPADFIEWHSGYQVEKLRQFPGAVPPNSLTLTIAGQSVVFFLSNDGRSVINANALQKADIAKLLPADQTALMQTSAWAALSASLRVEAKTTALFNQLIGDANKTARNADTAQHQSARYLIESAYDARSTWNPMTTTERDYYLRQVNLIADRIDEMAIIDPLSIRSELAKIVERFKRAFDFAETRPQLTITTWRGFEWDADDSTRGTQIGGDASGLYFGRLVSSDNNQTIRNGFAEFIRAERVILAAMETREATAKSVEFRDPKLDVPNLIFRLQALYEVQAGGVGDAGTEEIRQLHKLLTDYGVMQRLVQETIGEYNAKEADEKRRFLNIGGTDGDQGAGKTDAIIDYTYALTPVNGVTPTGDSAPGATNTIVDDTPKYDFATNLNTRTPAERAAISMFAADSYFQNTNRHPVEVRAGITDRPRIEFVDESEDGEASLFLYRKGKWDSFSTQLADTVTILNQQNQIKQNDIENAKKQENRHFDLANNALRKMNDMLLTIGRI